MPDSSDTLQPTRSAHIAGDLWGGTAAMLVALPSAIAFGVAIVAPLGGGLRAQGAVAGILGAVALGLVTPLLGGSTRLITAPCAPAAAVLSALAAGYASTGVALEQALVLLGLIGLLCGLIQIGLGLAGIGQLIKYIPFPVVSGYLSGVGLIIIGSQIPKFLGVVGASGFLSALSSPSLWQWQSALVGSVVVAAMLLMPYLTKAVPATILALVSGVVCYGLLAWWDPALRSADNNPLLVGPLTGSGASLQDSLGIHLPAPSLLTWATLLQVGVPALTLALLLSIDTLKTCLVIDAMSNSSHNSNRELVGQGVGNMAASMLGGIPGAGTMGASLINISSGGTTKLSGFVTGVASLVALLLLSPLIAWVPVAALAGILIVTGFRMIDRHSLSFFNTRDTRLDFMVILAVILVALFGNLIAASGVGVALAILLFVREQTRSSVVRSRTEGAEVFGRRLPGPHADAPAIALGYEAVVFELQGSLFFGTASQLHAALEPETSSHKYIILNMHRVQSLDVTATHVLEQIKDQLERNGAYLVFCDIPKDLPSGLKMKRFLKETGVVRPTSKAFAFRQLEDALKWVEEREHPSGLDDFKLLTAMDLNDMPVLASASQAEREVLAQTVQARTVHVGRKVFKKDRGDDCLYLVRSGLISTEVTPHKKDRLLLATVEPGDVLCGNRFQDNAGLYREAIAVEETQVFELSRAQFDTLAAQHGTLAACLLDALAHTAARELASAATQLTFTGP